MGDWQKKTRGENDSMLARATSSLGSWRDRSSPASVPSPPDLQNSARRIDLFNSRNLDMIDPNRLNMRSNLAFEASPRENPHTSPQLQAAWGSLGAHHNSTRPINPYLNGHRCAVARGSSENLDLPGVEGTILSLVPGSDSEHDLDWSEQSEDLDADDNNSDWEEFQEEIFFEDLPRLGIVQPDECFATDPLPWQLADEY
ncbi:hypothetical protein R1sor_024692 [Riccia sorocarpa]|uniref:Uncharacterized protein n=1 Tax=Riccia sorocarpa TaxID=122646 RepID=A0ABD3GT39_9MARC